MKNSKIINQTKAIKSINDLNKLGKKANKLIKLNQFLHQLLNFYKVSENEVKTLLSLFNKKENNYGNNLEEILLKFNCKIKENIRVIKKSINELNNKNKKLEKILNESTEDLLNKNDILKEKYFLLKNKALEKDAIIFQYKEDKRNLRETKTELIFHIFVDNDGMNEISESINNPFNQNLRPDLCKSQYISSEYVEELLNKKIERFREVFAQDMRSHNSVIIKVSKLEKQKVNLSRMIDTMKSNSDIEEDITFYKIMSRNKVFGINRKINLKRSFGFREKVEVNLKSNGKKEEIYKIKDESNDENNVSNGNCGSGKNDLNRILMNNKGLISMKKHEVKKFVFDHKGNKCEAKKLLNSTAIPKLSLSQIEVKKEVGDSESEDNLDDLIYEAELDEKIKEIRAKISDIKLQNNNYKTDIRNYVEDLRRIQSSIPISKVFNKTNYNNNE